MHRMATNSLQGIFLVFALAAQSAYAAVTTVTYEGIFFLNPGLPASFPPMYVDQTGLLPFGPPPDGTIVKLSFTYDTEAPVSNPPVPGGNPDAYALTMQSLSFEFGGYSFTHTSDNYLVVINNSVLTGGLGGYYDAWLGIHQEGDPLGFSTSTSFGVNYFSSFASPTGGPLDGIDTSTSPIYSAWDQAFLNYQVIDRSPLASGDPYASQKVSYMRAIITDVSVEVTPVPIPAAAWLFGSAITGLFGFKRFSRNRTQ